MNRRYYQTGNDHSLSKYQRKGISLYVTIREYIVISVLFVPSKVFLCRVVIDRVEME